MTVWREPPDETQDYPGLYVNDGRVTGSITAGPTRLPLWAFAGYASWDEVEESFPAIGDEYGWTQRQHGQFLTRLLQARGEFGRLLLAIANAERADAERQLTDDETHFATVHPYRPVCECEGRTDLPAWWDDDELKAPVVELLRACLDRLEGGPDLGQEA